MKQDNDYETILCTKVDSDHCKKQRFNPQYNCIMPGQYYPSVQFDTNYSFYQPVDTFSYMNDMFIGKNFKVQLMQFLDRLLTVNPAMRTIYLGGLPENVTYRQIADQISTGAIEKMKILPEKNCAFVTFVDAKCALNFYLQTRYSSLKINSHVIRVGGGRLSFASPLIIEDVISGASRTIFISNIEPNITEDFLREEIGIFGIIENIQIIPDKKFAFVHMTSIKSAKKAIFALNTSVYWSNMRINFGKDRCESDQKTYINPYRSCNPFDGFQQDTFQKNDLFAANRTVYIGNIHTDVTVRELCEVIRGGSIQNIKYFHDKNIAFVTFIYSRSAQEFYSWANDNLELKGKRLKIGFGRPSLLPSVIYEAFKKGASRIVYIGSIDETVTEDKLRKDFGDFGEIELINIIPKKNICFVNFLDITSAMKAIEIMKNVQEYSKFKLSFGKDKCRKSCRDTEKSQNKESSPLFGSQFPI